MLKSNNLATSVRIDPVPAPTPAEKAAAAIAAMTSWDDFLRYLEKPASSDLAGQAVAARRHLGRIGVSPDTLDRVSTGLRKGTMSESTAGNLVADARDTSVEQAINVPSAVGTALEQGDVSGALADADVLGLKNLTTLPGATAGLVGAVSGGLLGRRQARFSNEKNIGQIHTDATDLVAAKETLKALDERIKAHGSDRATLMGAKPPKAVQIDGQVHTLDAVKRRRADVAARVGKLEASQPKSTAKGVKPSLPTASRLPAIGGAMLGALVPALAMEWAPHLSWMGKKYRSGSRSVEDLARVNKQLAATEESK